MANPSEKYFKDHFLGNVDPEQWKREHPLAKVHVTHDPARDGCTVTMLRCPTTDEILVIEIKEPKKRWSIKPWITKTIRGIKLKWKF